MVLPDIIETIDYDTLKADTLAYLGGFVDVQFLESDSVSLIIEAFIYREMLLRERINNSARASYLYSATKGDLDNIVASAKVQRLEAESDESLRERYLLSLNQFSTAGASDSYRFWAMSVSSDIKQVKTLRPQAGTVEVVYYSSVDHTADITTVLNSDDVVPLCDTVIVTRATQKAVTLILSLQLQSGADMIAVRDLINTSFIALNASLGIGDDVPLSKLYATAQVAGVYKVTMDATSDITASEREVLKFTILFN